MMLTTGEPSLKPTRNRGTIMTSKTQLTLVVNNDASSNSADPSPQAHRRREDREIKESFFDLPLYGPSPQRLPWEFLRVA